MPAHTPECMDDVDTLGMLQDFTTPIVSEIPIDIIIIPVPTSAPMLFQAIHNSLHLELLFLFYFLAVGNTVIFLF